MTWLFIEQSLNRAGILCHWTVRISSSFTSLSEPWRQWSSWTFCSHGDKHETHNKWALRHMRPVSWKCHPCAPLLISHLFMTFCKYHCHSHRQRSSIKLTICESEIHLMWVRDDQWASYHPALKKNVGVFETQESASSWYLKMIYGAVLQQKYSLSIHWRLQSQRLQIELALAFTGISCDAHFLWLCHHSWTLLVRKLIHHPKAKFNIPLAKLNIIKGNQPRHWLAGKLVRSF